MYTRYSLAVSGIQGSGKSTLARGLARRFGWFYLAESQTAQRYIPDLFEDMARWAFEAQLGFFCNKAVMMLDRLRGGENIVVDRTLHEDCYVFAEYFRRIRKIDDRAYATYKSLAEYFFAQVPPPDLVLYCKCPLPLVEKRIDERKREFQKHYPPNHLRDIEELYEAWIAGYKNSPVFEIDSARYDFRSETTIARIYHEVFDLLESAQPRSTQLDLFAIAPDAQLFDDVPIPNILRELVPMRQPTVVRQALSTQITLRTDVPEFPFAYVAAPFTSLTETRDAPSERSELFPFVRPHGTISRGEFRSCLLAIARALDTFGINALLPHRDVNEWGKRVLTPQQVYESCTSHVSSCDLFVGLLGESCGAHYEFGLAQALNKPRIIIRCGEMASSFMSQGIADTQGNTLLLQCVTMKEIPEALRTPRVREFLRMFIPVKENA
ncbi:MAG: deoxynucleoside kinase [Verrucomicrobiia bacterium]